MIWRNERVTQYCVMLHARKWQSGDNYRTDKRMFLDVGGHSDRSIRQWPFAFKAREDIARQSISFPLALADGFSAVPPRATF